MDIDYQYLRPQKASNLKKMHNEVFEERKDLQIWQGDSATILPVRSDDGWFGKGGVVDRSGNYVEMSATTPTVRNGYYVEHPEYKDEKVVYCGYLVNHWGHYLVEGVARLWYFLENDPTIDKYVFVLRENEQREIKNNYREFLELLKIWDRIEIINKPTTYRTVIVPELALRYDYFSPRYLEIFNVVANNIQVKSEWKPIKKIYWSRSKWGRGQSKKNKLEFGGEALDNFYIKNGYVVLFPERVPLAEMIFYIRNADVVAAVSGTLPHNMLFGRSGQRVEIAERCAVNNEWQARINRMMRLRTTYIDANISIYTVGMTFSI